MTGLYLDLAKLHGGRAPCGNLLADIAKKLGRSLREDEKTSAVLNLSKAGLSVRKISTLTGVPPSTVHDKIKAARK